MQGRAVFDKALTEAFWEDIRKLLGDRSIGLMSFDEVKDRLRLNDQTYRGLQEIPLERIVGSVGRYKEFTRHFLPRRASMAERWTNVYAQMNSMTGVPPIDVFKVDDVYFVRDGNHRVSIARQIGMEKIEAYVTELHTPIDLEPGMSQKQFESATAYGKFLEATQLNRSRPTQQRITLTEPHRYLDLMQHIHLVKHVMESNRGHEVTFEDAAARWYDKIYLPTIELIRKYNLLPNFPRRTEADLYVWIIDHFRKLIDEYGEGSGQVKLSAAMVDFLAENKIAIPKRLLTEDDEALL